MHGNVNDNLQANVKGVQDVMMKLLSLCREFTDVVWCERVRSNVRSGSLTASSRSLRALPLLLFFQTPASRPNFVRNREVRFISQGSGNQDFSNQLPTSGERNRRLSQRIKGLVESKQQYLILKDYTRLYR